MTDRPRDTQRQRLYDAEAELAHGATMSWPEVEAFVKRVTESTWYQQRWYRRDIEPVMKRGGSAYGYRWQGRITLPLFARTRLTILHEIAHCLTPDQYAAHGREYCGIYLALVGHFLGADTRRELRAAMRKHRVRVSNAGLPTGRHTVPTMAERRAAAKARDRRPLSGPERRELAGLLRRAAASGQLGPAGRSARTHGLAIARQLDIERG